MKLFFTLTDALIFLKEEIEEFEKEKAQVKDEYRKKYLEMLIEWRVERGLEMFKYADKKEKDKNLLDFFLGRAEIRPNLESDYKSLVDLEKQLKYNKGGRRSKEGLTKRVKAWFKSHL